MIPEIPRAVWGWFFAPVDVAPACPDETEASDDVELETSVVRLPEPCRSLGHMSVVDAGVCDYCLEPVA